MQANETHSLTIEALINQGSGLARLPSGQVVFIRDTLPGEQVRLQSQALEKQKGVLWANAYELLKPSPRRVEPSCPHSKLCGGCATLHINPRYELAEKALVVRDLLQRLGKWSQPLLTCVDFPPNESRYRGKFHADTQHCGWKSARSNQIIDVRQCHVLPQSLQAALPAIQDAARQAAFAGHVYFAVHHSNQQIVLRFEGQAKSLEPLAALQKHHGSIQGIAWADGSGRPKRQWGDPKLTLQWQTFQVTIRAAQFFQSNPASWPVFHQILQRYLNQCDPESIWDMHAGSGFLTAGLGGRQVFASEPDALAFAQLKRNLRKRRGSHSAFQGTAEQAMRSRQEPHQKMAGAVLDPPRAGLTKTLRKWLISKGPKSLLYFSCDVATFARDLAQLQQSYVPLDPAYVLNVNPGTLRVEIAVIFVRR